ncbi:F0F1 ATP synthase subunit B [Numidum massiliense]|uniref:F0F1 ATP synthase subunit B n=1 Tax=Numidum massiliense TaxID=1522315 RepID=UPI0006D59EF2|nr:F0F1 ATP synthase subunit B [Numidum massiliense]
MPNIEWGTMLFTLVVFMILLALLKRYALGPLLGIMQKRQERVESELATAEKNRQESETLLAKQREELENVRHEAQGIVERATKTADTQARELLQAARQEADRLKTEAQNDIQREKERAISELRDQVGTLSVLLASKIIEKELDDAAQKALVDDYIKEVSDRL